MAQGKRKAIVVPFRNETDPFTLERLDEFDPSEVIQINEHGFHLADLYNWAVNRQSPRNPITNIAFSEEQMIAIKEAAREKYGLDVLINFSACDSVVIKTTALVSAQILWRKIIMILHHKEVKTLTEIVCELINFEGNWDMGKLIQLLRAPNKMVKDLNLPLDSFVLTRNRTNSFHIAIELQLSLRDILITHAINVPGELNTSIMSNAYNVYRTDDVNFYRLARIKWDKHHERERQPDATKRLRVHLMISLPFFAFGEFVMFVSPDTRVQELQVQIANRLIAKPLSSVILQCKFRYAHAGVFLPQDRRLGDVDGLLDTPAVLRVLEY